MKANSTKCFTLEKEINKLNAKIIKSKECEITTNKNILQKTDNPT